MNSTLRIKKSLLLVTMGVMTLFRCSFSDHNISPSRANAGQTVSGVQGEVLLGPIHNGPPQAGDNADIGFAALFYVYDDRGGMVATFNSDWDGWFNVALAPGHYVIIPDSSAPIWDPQKQAQQVTVVAGKFSQVTLRFAQPS